MCGLCGGGGDDDDDGGVAVLFFWIQNRMFERFTPKYSISFFYSGFAHFHDVCFYLTIYRVILSLGGGNSVTYPRVTHVLGPGCRVYFAYWYYKQ